MLGALAACLDLFLLDAGPGLRGKLSHGEAALLPAGAQLEPPSAVEAILFALVVGLCAEHVEENADDVGGEVRVEFLLQVTAELVCPRSLAGANSSIYQSGIDSNRPKSDGECFRWRPRGPRGRARASDSLTSASRTYAAIAPFTTRTCGCR